MRALPRLRPLFIWSLRVLIGLLVLLLALVLAVRWWVTTGSGHSFIQTRLNDLSVSGQVIELAGLRGDPLGIFHIDTLRIRDADGVWLEGQDLKLDWSPWPLLRRKLEINTVSGGQIKFRRPALAPSQTAASSSSFALDTVELGRLRVPHLEYSGAETDTRPIFSLTGTGHYKHHSFAAKVDLVPVESTADTISIDLSQARAAPLSGHAHIYGDAGGSIADIVGLDAADSLTIELDASGTPDTWQMQTRLDISGKRMASLSGQTHGTLTRLEGRFEKALPWIPQAIADRLAQQTDFMITANEIGDDALALTADISSDAFAVKAAGTSRRDSKASNLSNLNIHVQIPEGSPVLDGTGVHLQAVHYDGAVHYTSWDDIALRGTFTISALRHDAVQLESLGGPIELTLSGTSLALSSQIGMKRLLRPDGTALPLLGHAPELAFAANLDRSTNAATFTSLTLDGADIKLNARQRENWLVGDVTTDLGAFGLGALGLGDSAAFGGKFRLSLPSADDMRLSLEGSLDGLSVPPAVTGLSETVDLELGVTRSPNGFIRVNRLNATSGQLVLAATGERHPEGKLSLSATATAQRLSYADTNHVQEIELTTTLAGTLEQYNFTGEVSARQASFGSNLIEGVQAKLNGGGSADMLAATLGLSADTEFGRLTLEAAPELMAGEWDTGAILATLGTFSADGALSGPIADPLSASGALHLGGVPDNVPLEALDLKLAISDGDMVLTSTAKIEAMAGFTPSDVQLTARGTLDSFDADMHIETKLSTASRSNPVMLDAALMGGLSSGRVSLDIDGLYGTYPIQTDRSFIFDWSSDMPSLSGALQAFAGRIDLSAIRAGSGVAGQVSLDGLSLARVSEAFALSPIAGSLSTRFVFDTGTAKHLQIDGNVSDLTTAIAGLDPVNLSFEAQLDHDALNAKARAYADDAELGFTLTGASDWTSSFPQPDRTRPLEFTLLGAGAIDAFSALVLPPEMALSGKLDANISGQITSGSLSGTGHLSLLDGGFEHGDLGLTLTDLALETHLDGDTLSLGSLVAQSGSDGRMSGSGHVSLSGQTSDEISLQIVNLTVLDRSDMNARASGDMKIQRTDGKTRIDGELTLDRANIRLNHLVQSAKPTLPVRFADEQTKPEAAETRTRLDIRINAPRRIFAEGRGLDAELSAAARIRGTATAPQITAEANIVRGDYTFAGQSFDLVDSRITLAPGSDEANLNIRAERRAADLTAIVSITGTQKRPVITMSSDPSLPESEILSRLLFGLSPGQLTPVQSARLAATLASLAGGSGFDVLGRLENVLFLDTLDFSENSDGTAIITTGKYIRPNVYVEAQNSLDGDVGVAIDWEPFDNTTVRGETNSEAGQELSVRWRRDFDRLAPREEPDTDEALQ